MKTTIAGTVLPAVLCWCSAATSGLLVSDPSHRLGRRASASEGGLDTLHHAPTQQCACMEEACIDANREPSKTRIDMQGR